MCTKNDFARISILNFIGKNHPEFCNDTLQFSSESDDKYHSIPTLVAEYFRDAEERGHGFHFCDNYLFIIGDFDTEKSKIFNDNLDGIKKSLSDQDKLGVPSIIIFDACPNDPNIDDDVLHFLAPLLSRGFDKEYNKEFREKCGKARIVFLLKMLSVSLDGCNQSDCEICGDEASK
jgi:hypothetical protein